MKKHSKQSATSISHQVDVVQSNTDSSFTRYYARFVPRRNIENINWQPSQASREQELPPLHRIRRHSNPLLCFDQGRQQRRCSHNIPPERLSRMALSSDDGNNFNVGKMGHHEARWKSTTRRHEEQRIKASICEWIYCDISNAFFFDIN